LVAVSDGRPRPPTARTAPSPRRPARALRGIGSLPHTSRRHRESYGRPVHTCAFPRTSPSRPLRAAPRRAGPVELGRLTGSRSGSRASKTGPRVPRRRRRSLGLRATAILASVRGPGSRPPAPSRVSTELQRAAAALAEAGAFRGNPPFPPLAGPAPGPNRARGRQVRRPSAGEAAGRCVFAGPAQGIPEERRASPSCRRRFAEAPPEAPRTLRLHHLRRWPRAAPRSLSEIGPALNLGRRSVPRHPGFVPRFRRSSRKALGSHSACVACLHLTRG